MVLRCCTSGRRVRPPFKHDQPVVHLLESIAGSSETAISTSFYEWLPYYLQALQSLMLARLDSVDGYDANLHSYLLAAHCLLAAADPARVPQAQAARLLGVLAPVLCPRRGPEGTP